MISGQWLREKEADGDGPRRPRIKRKYGKVLDEFRKEQYQDMLKYHLAIQDDQMVFINTPNLSKRRPQRPHDNVCDRISHQVFVYSDYGLKPGKYSVLVYDCLDNTLWYKTIVVSHRKR